MGYRIRCLDSRCCSQRRERFIGYNITLHVSGRHPYTGSQQKRQSLRHALFVAFHYPPEASSSGVLRTLKYSRYLPERGWRVTVITPHTSAYTVCDSQLEEQISSSTRVIRTPYLNIKRHLSVRGR